MDNTLTTAQDFARLNMVEIKIGVLRTPCRRTRQKMGRLYPTPVDALPAAA